MKNLRVITLTADTTEKFYIVRSEDIKTNKVCETYDNDGQFVGCYDAGCYSLDNSCSDFLENLLENFKISLEDQGGITTTKELFEALDYEEIEYNQESIEEWIDDETVHTESNETIEWWDGSNNKGLVNTEEYTAFSIVDEETEAEILKAYESAEFEKNQWWQEARTEKYIFTETPTAGFEEAVVETRDLNAEQEEEEEFNFYNDIDES